MGDNIIVGRNYPLPPIVALLPDGHRPAQAGLFVLRFDRQ